VILPACRQEFSQIKSLTNNQLRPPCIELSSVGLRFRGQQASVKSLLQALEALHAVIVDLGRSDVLDEKLAEYAFFPLSNVFNESQRLSSRCLEVAVLSLQVLVSRGWRQKLQPAMGNQLLILLSLLAGGSPSRPKASGLDSVPSEELISACFECMSSLFECMGQANRHIFDETGAKTIVDQALYLLLEAITENPSVRVQLSAVNACQNLLSQISSRVLLASLLPRTVSALTKALKPNTQIRRPHKVLVALVELLSHILAAVLADKVAISARPPQVAGSEVSRQLPGTADEISTLDDKWLKATASQVKLALAGVVQVRSHERPEVRHALFRLGLLICEKCSKTLFDSLQLMLETMVMVTDCDQASTPAREKQLLKHLILSSADLTDMLRLSLNSWISTLPRVMQGNDDKPKRQVLRQISTAAQILLEGGDDTDLLHESLATSLVESVSTGIDISAGKSLQKIREEPSAAQSTHFGQLIPLKHFEPVIMGQKSPLHPLVELRALISQMRDSSASEPLTRSIMARIGQSPGSQQVSALWLTLSFLSEYKPAFSMSELVDITPVSFDSIAYLISDLYSVCLPLILDRTMDSTSHDWRITALALESIVLQAKQLGLSYRPELIDTLYPILSQLGSPEPRLQSHAMTALNLLATACEYPDTSTMLVENVDYLINSIALKLNTFDLSPQGPQVLLMLLRLCGARLIPYLDDLIGSIFAALDNFHGYPRLVELLFDVLGVAVDEAAKNPALTMINGIKEPDHKKTAYSPSTMDDILNDIRVHRARKDRLKAEMLGQQLGEDAPNSAPHRPWTSKLDGSQKVHEKHETLEADLGDDDDSDDKAEAPSSHKEEKEPSLSKPHTLLLSIARSTIPHLSSPSPRVRLTLLQLITRIAPVLSRHENSFLPLVNDLWPAILPRLFSSENTTNSGDQGEARQDPNYVTTAAADTIAAICVGAGDFMRGRIEAIFPSLERLYKTVWKEVEQDRLRMAQHRRPIGKIANTPTTASAGINLKGTVDLRIVDGPTAGRNTSSLTDTSTGNDTRLAKSQLPAHPPSTMIPLHQTSKTTNSHTRIHTSLLTLLSTILTHLSIPPASEIGDAILGLLAPVMDDPGNEPVRSALEKWNADAVWVARETGVIEREMYAGARESGDWSWAGRGQGRGSGVERPEPVQVPRGNGDTAESWEFADVLF
jgi:TELO2-interacting protein 1